MDIRDISMNYINLSIALWSENPADATTSAYYLNSNDSVTRSSLFNVRYLGFCVRSHQNN